MQDILLRLKQQGHRITQARQGILATFENATKPLTPTDIIQTLKQQGRGADKVTVYRELAFLQSQGIITEVQLSGRAKRYELAELDHHHHLVCLSCDKVEDVDVHDDFSQTEKAIKKRTGFSTLRHSLEFFGTCSTCR